MPKTLTEADAFDPVVVPQDGEAATATASADPRVDLEEVLQTLTNRSRWLLARLLRPASKANDLTALAAGAEMVVWQAPDAGLAAGALVQIDAGADWRDRLVLGVWFPFTGDALLRVGQGSDYMADTGDQVSEFFAGYLGTGALSDVATGAAVAPGAPPVKGAGAGGRSYYLRMEPSGATMVDVRLYCDPVDGTLYLYNAEATATVWPLLVLIGTGPTGKR